MIDRIFILILLATSAVAGPYPGAAGASGSDAISKDDPRFVQWVSGHLDYVLGANVTNSWRTPAKAYGPATEDVFDIVCLGDGGKITLYFPHPIMDGEGADFAVFENSFSNTFLELAFVEVSSDGVNFIRFPSASLTSSATNSIDPTNLRGLAGKHRGGFGTPFDLADLSAPPTLDKNNVRFVRLIDILGNGTSKDSDNRPIFDPYPTTGSAGFDLDAIGVIHRNNGDFPIVLSGLDGGGFEIEWGSNPGNRYRIEKSPDCVEWLPVQELPADPTGGSTSFSVAKPAEAKFFWRVVRLD
ncbi:PEP-CTERM sorting domain-containing protein [Luteolibacter luteus]|uniref:PEP-CTERM sorting domain-containing protein n=1 Tax=Luteolibacter luteus TaxID=2728835 RepID=A0A858RL02_9BACT|nr:PEP-CTERM sorting domain-containing protein [Luteolibacter luteus]QJE97617.1 PEP-CTERM sorting domain-containing protein [Luteolibacter luteus]